MENELLKKLFQTKKGDRIEINGKTFSIQKKMISEGCEKEDPDILHLDLGNNYFLEVEFDEPKFFQNIEKKGWIFDSTKSKYEKINSIELK